MLPYSHIYDAPFSKLQSWWRGIERLPEEFRENGIEEVAYALSQNRSAGVQELKQSLGSADLDRRRAALYFLAYPDIADEEVREALLQAFHSGVRPLVQTALWGFIHLDFFPLERAFLTALLDCDDQRLAAVAMVYLSRAYPEETVAILARALRDENPRMREYSCDEIGDRGIAELKAAMHALLADADPDVAQAAASNIAL